MKVQFELAKEDYIQYNLHYMRESEAIKKSFFIQRYVVSLIYLVLPFILVKVSDMPFRYLMIVFLVTYLIWVLYYPKYFASFTKKRLQKIINEGKNVSLFGARSISLDQGGIVESSNTGESKTSWTAVERVEETNKYIFIYVSSVNAYIVPARAFADLKQKKEFIDILKEYCSTYKKIS
jgi:hypothetical protein